MAWPFSMPRMKTIKLQLTANIPGQHILPTRMWKDPLKLLSITLNDIFLHKNVNNIK